MAAFLRTLKHHAIPLSIIALSLVISQIIVLKQVPFIGSYPDSPSYLGVAANIQNHFDFGNNIRLYGYPLFLAAIFLLTHNSLNVVIFIQAVLFIATTFEIYVLVYHLTKNRWIAMSVGAFVGINVYFAQWERMIMTETLCMWVLVTMFLLLERYVRDPSIVLLVIIAFMAGFGILVRPNYIFMPVVLGITIAFLHVRLRNLRQSIVRVALLLCISYGLVGTQFIANFYSPVHFAGLSSLGSINLLGKIMEYHMELDTNDPRFNRIKADVHVYVQQGGVVPWFFLDKHPQYFANNNAIVDQYSNAIILHHPVTFLLKLPPDIFRTVYIHPFAYGQINLTQNIPMKVMSWFEKQIMRIYLLLPLAIVIEYVWITRRKFTPTTIMIMSLTLFVLGTIFFAAMGNYGQQAYDEFYRLRYPADWMILVIYAGIASTYINKDSSSQSASEDVLISTVKRARVVK